VVPTFEGKAFVPPNGPKKVCSENLTSPEGEGKGTDQKKKKEEGRKKRREIRGGKGQKSSFCSFEKKDFDPVRASGRLNAKFFLKKKKKGPPSGKTPDVVGGGGGVGGYLISRQVS